MSPSFPNASAIVLLLELFYTFSLYGIVEARAVTEIHNGGTIEFYHHGSPAAVPKATDCAIRQAAYEYGQKLMPQRGTFPSLFDALQLGACGRSVDAEERRRDSRSEPLQEPIPVDDVLIVVLSRSSEALDEGVLKRRLRMHRDLHFVRSIHEALDLSRTLRAGTEVLKKTITVALKGGVHYLDDTLSLTSEDAGITIRNMPGERAVVSGGLEISTDWKLSQRCKRRTCFEADLNGQNVGSIPGLRLNGERQIRARFPNFDSERDSVIDGRHHVLDGRDGWIQRKTEWLGSGNHRMNGVQGWPPRKSAKTYVVDAQDWPSVDWPMNIMTNGSKHDDAWTGEGDWGKFYIGVGGTCVDRDPPVGYWCSPVAPRHISAANHPVGIKTNDQNLPNSPYEDPQGAVIHAWRVGHWYTNMLRVGSVQSTTHKGEQVLLFDHGGFQGGEGVRQGENWYIENVFEELDSEREFFYDESISKLYYIPNASDVSLTGFVATRLKELVRIQGTQREPVRNITLKGLIFRDTAYSYMDSHGLPSGGDWALAKQGTITVFGSEGLTISENIFTALDGTGIFVGDYNRDLAIADNEFKGIGESAIAAWGSTSKCLNENCSLSLPYDVGPDGRKGNQPRGCKVERNLVHEIGLWQKQSSFFFQAVTAGTTIKDNVFFNGPRAAVNFNDGFGGGDIVEGNLLLNTCRESSDHGPFNSWDRVPYITTIRNGKPSIVPKERTIRRNFVIGTYHSQEAFDTDDGSSYYKFYNNVMAYAENGLKSDFGGHDVEFSSNLLAYVGTCFNTWGFKGYNDKFENNECIFINGYRSTCGTDPTFHVGNNRIYSKTGSMKVCGMSFKEWQEAGHDRSTRLSMWPSDEELVQSIKRVLQY